MKNIYVTVCTPTYNRGGILHRPFFSLLHQTCKEFIWLIIDDGSDDNTKDIVDGFIKIADFPINYYFKQNGGRHTALNFSYNKIDTEFVINLDSDDELCFDAIEKINKIIRNEKIYISKNIWQISGRCIDSKTGKIVGKTFPDNINSLSGRKQRKERSKSYGEKSNCRKVSVLKKFPFPVYEDTKFVSENTVWEKIDLNYNSYCTNEAFCIYYQDSPDSLAKGKMHNDTKYRTQFYYSIFAINNLIKELPYNKSAFYSLFNIPRTAILSNMKYSEVMKKINNPVVRIVITLLGFPIACIYIKIFENNVKIKKFILKRINKED